MKFIEKSSDSEVEKMMIEEGYTSKSDFVPLHYSNTTVIILFELASRHSPLILRNFPDHCRFDPMPCCDFDDLVWVIAYQNHTNTHVPGFVSFFF